MCVCVWIRVVYLYMYHVCIVRRKKSCISKCAVIVLVSCSFCNVLTIVTSMVIIPVSSSSTTRPPSLCCKHTAYIVELPRQEEEKINRGESRVSIIQVHSFLPFPYPPTLHLSTQTNENPTCGPHLPPHPPMIPPLATRKIRLHPRILDRHTSPYTPLKHSTTIQPANLPAPNTQPTRIGALATSFLFRHTVAVVI
jgi:hypothetical protein